MDSDADFCEICILHISPSAFQNLHCHRPRNVDSAVAFWDLGDLPWRPSRFFWDGSWFRLQLWMDPDSFWANPIFISARILNGRIVNLESEIWNLKSEICNIKCNGDSRFHIDHPNSQMNRYILDFRVQILISRISKQLPKLERNPIESNLSNRIS